MSLLNLFNLKLMVENLQSKPLGDLQNTHFLNETCNFFKLFFDLPFLNPIVVINYLNNN